MENSRFDMFNIRIPDEDWDDATFNELVEKYPNATIGDIIYSESQNVFEETIKSGRIFLYRPKELFWGLNEEQILSMKHRLDEISIIDYLDAPAEIRKKIRTWMVEYHEYIYLLNLRTGFQQLRTKYITSKQQVLLFHYLYSAKYINIELFPQDNTKVVLLLEALFNRNYDNLYKEYSLYQRTNFKENKLLFSKNNLEKVRDVFLNAHFEEAVKLVEKDIKKLVPAKK